MCVAGGGGSSEKKCTVSPLLAPWEMSVCVLMGGRVYIIYNGAGCSKKQQHYYYSPPVCYSWNGYLCVSWGGGSRKTWSVLCAMGSKFGVGIARDWGGLY